MAKKKQKQPVLAKSALFDRVVGILEQARSNVVRTVNSQMVIAYWLIGCEIVEEEQKGEARAEYGKQLVENLSRQLTNRYGRGFSLPSLWNFRQFYLSFSDRKPEILSTVGRELELPKKLSTACREFADDKIGHPMGDLLAEPENCKADQTEPLEKVTHSVTSSRKGFHSALSWSHYRALMRVENENAQSFYEIEAPKNGWSVRQLERQIHTFYYERLLKSRDKEGMTKLANQGETAEHPLDVIKDPYVLEFLDLPESHRLVENDLEGALISRLQEFLLELGAGFAFIGRQVRLTLDGDHFYPDLIFYHTRLKCYVIIDLKIEKLTHGDLGQMQMYVNYYDEEVCAEDDNPTVGLILCAEKNDSVVRYVLGKENEQIFASRYRLQLPSEDELRRELKRERQAIEENLESKEAES